MVRLVDLALHDLTGNFDSHAADLVFQVVDSFLAFLGNVCLRRSADGRRLSPGLADDLLLALLGAGGCLAQHGVAFILDALQVVGVLLLEIRSLLFGGIRVGIHRIDLLLAVIDHLLHRLEKELFQHRKGDEHIAEGKQRSPRVDAYKTFKARHELFLQFSSLIRTQRAAAAR